MCNKKKDPECDFDLTDDWTLVAIIIGCLIMLGFVQMTYLAIRYGLMDPPKVTAHISGQKTGPVYRLFARAVFMSCLGHPGISSPVPCEVNGRARVTRGMAGIGRFMDGIAKWEHIRHRSCGLIAIPGTR
ncbi:hypothetical protein Bbelb_358060 [Branchiostoma belcheri]|nr:hypothetical protein Bbelb_358060 [Branchiostoma belcheri]